MAGRDIRPDVIDTLGWQVFSCLGETCLPNGAESAPLPGPKQQRHVAQLSKNWLAAILTYSARGASALLVLSQEDSIHDLLELSGTYNLTAADRFAMHANELMRSLPPALRSQLDLSYLLANTPAAKMRFVSKLPEGVGVPNFMDKLVDAAENDWLQRGVQYEPAMLCQDLAAEVMALRSMFFILKFLQMLMTCKQQYAQIVTEPLWQALIMAAELVEKQALHDGRSAISPHQPRSDDADAQSIKQVATAIMSLLLQILRSSLKSDSPETEAWRACFCCQIIKSVCLVAVDTVAAELLKSGGLLLLLAAMDTGPDIGADAKTASHVAEVMARLISINPGGTTPELSQHQLAARSWLARMQAISRLSMLLVPWFYQEKGKDGPEFIREVQELFDGRETTHFAKPSPGLTDVPTQCARLLRVANTMLAILEPDPGQQPATAAPSARAWESTTLVARRALLLLNWMSRPAFERQCTEGSPQLEPQCMLLKESLLRLLDRLLTGHLEGNLDISGLLQAGISGIVSRVFAELKAISGVTGHSRGTICSDSLLKALLSRLVADTESPASGEATKLQWDEIVNIWKCFCVEAPLTASSPATGAAMELLYLSNCGDHVGPSGMLEGFHEAIVELQKQPVAQLTACASLVALCAQSVQTKAWVQTAKYCRTAAANGSIPEVLQCLRKAMTMPAPWSSEFVVGIGRLLAECSHLPQQLLAFANTPRALLSVVSELLKAIHRVQGPFTHAQYLLSALVQTSDVLPEADLQSFAEHSSMELAQALMSCWHYGLLGSDQQRSDPVMKQSKVKMLECKMLQYTLGDVLKRAETPAALDTFSFLAWEASKLAVQWLGMVRQPQGTPELGPWAQDFEPAVFVSMAAEYRTRAKGSLIQPLIPIVHSALAQLSVQLLVLTVEHGSWRKEQAAILSAAGVQNLAQLPSSFTAERRVLAASKQRVYSTKEALERLLQAVETVAMDRALLAALAQTGPDAWWIDSQSKVTVARNLADVTAWRALPITTIRRVEDCFDLTRDKDAWKAAGDQLIAEEQQAAAAAAAKKAKKAKLKLKKQAQQVLQPEDDTPLANSASEDTQLAPAEAPEAYDTDDGRHSSQPSVSHSDSRSEEASDLQALSLSGCPSADTDRHQQTQPPCTAQLASDVNAADHAAAQDKNVEPAESTDESSFLDNLFSCPITEAIMDDCVIAADGYSYERAAIANWLLHSNCSPITGQPLQHQRLVPNVLLRSAISLHISTQAQA